MPSQNLILKLLKIGKMKNPSPPFLGEPCLASQPPSLGIWGTGLGSRVPAGTHPWAKTGRALSTLWC